jgi:predicted metal-dependent TIM-barrel fold hydrolase
VLLAAARQAGVRRFLVQHPSFTVPALGPDELRPLVEQGAIVELTYLNVSPLWRTSTVSEAAEILTRLGGDAVVVSSDAGQAHNPSPPEALRSFAQALYENGVAQPELGKALRDTPRRLLEQ